jgi:tRNA threonylcarbamoyl adenosine modification protein YjeE
VSRHHTFESHAIDDTAHVAAAVAAMLGPGDCVCLAGDLGAGKTTFTRHLVRAMGGDEREVSSPTYVLMHRYPTRAGVIYHMDAYRIDAEALDEMGFDEWLADARLMLIEWPSRIASRLPTSRIELRIEIVGESSRRFHLDDRRG